MKNVNSAILSALDTVSRNGIAVDANQLVTGSFHFLFSDNAVAGTVKMQASNDPNPSGSPSSFVPTNWIDITNATATVTAGAPQLIFLPNLAFRWVRAVFVQTTPGTGTVTCNMNAMSV